MKSTFFNNLRIKLMLLFLLSALLPLSIVGAFSIRTAEGLITNMVSNQLENVAHDKAALLDRWISERKSDLNVVAGSSILRSMEPERIASYIHLVMDNYQVYRRFVVLSRVGVAVFDSSGKGTIDIQEEWYKHSIDGELYTSDIFLDPEARESVFHVSAPILDDRGQVKGVTCATVGTRAILSKILQVSLGETGECYLVDKEGTFLAHKDSKRILTDNIAQSESFKNIFGAESLKKIYTDYRNIEVLGASRKVAGEDWYLVVEQDRDEAFREADRLKRYVYLAIVFSLIGAVILAWLLSYYVANPIRKLSQAAENLARGEFEQALVTSNRTDEIGMLYSAFGSMAKQLQARQHSLEEKVDLTEAELKKTEMAAARSQQLAALGRLAAGVTHEIRTPIASLKLFLESVEAEIEISPEYEEDFQVAMGQIKRIEATINRFLDFAKPQEPIFSMINAKDIIEEALLVVRPKANQQEAVISVLVDNELPEIRGDRKQLGEVLVNLMVNSLEAMTHRGELTVSARQDSRQTANGPRKCVLISVSDTGPGIGENNREKIFDPFFTTKASGTGLGLSIVHTVVRGHGGEITFDSVAGQGTTFHLFLPILESRGY
ncbi:MAG: HAMP domain-containing protein [Candidatus Abyssobacteria bacterium SURF_17]|uniref:histidine kinase n=1 Tax=Candidatus Abyssobacteria bacterium SURF_17 TaxID=2093361 RepID=A0A419EWL3_9BACT|nr:MAG: HAMP domain-containing protein [Candidatus Abyssubacteria bacterium SURF_17]